GVLASAPVLPCRFCTVYRDEADLRSFLAAREDALSAALERISGRIELGVKAFVDRARFATFAGTRSERIRELSERVTKAEGGRAYLETRQIDRLVAEELERFRQEAAPQLHERLLAAADDGVLLARQRPEVSGREEEMVLNGAYLVADRSRFEHALAGLARERREEGVELELTGPWPPYNFVPEELGSLPALTGVGGSPLERRRVSGLELVVSHVAGDEVTEEAVLRHAEVVEQLLGRSRAVLPARFGRPLAGEEELSAAVGASAPELERGLNRVRGCVELGLRVVAAPISPAPKGESGTEYMQARPAEEWRRRRLLDELDASL